ncbi:hypothetical protein JTB14_022229 [Gonioctena quinquepunctata]|nr:hypothetical protein JTB14_022229 [Gonioctena quinquepunctata]
MIQKLGKQQVNCGRATRLWLVKFFNGILNTGSLPPEFKRTKIVAILKTGKPQELPESYRPIALLSCCYKLLQRLLHNRICPAVDVLIPVEQAGFRSGSSFTDQVFSLTTHIQAWFERGLRTSVAFIDLTAAYETVWREGLIYKLLRVIPCLKMCHLINNLLANRLFQVFVNDAKSSTRKLNNGLPQGR